MTETPQEDVSTKRKDFICGVVEGFYGRPWTTEQRKDLFQKLKRWEMDMYVYAPKDDYKHRAYWRELYTVEEAEHLTSLITAAKDQNITFCYALSPGLDITYSSQKEITTLKRKLEQVSQFGCTCFALLFDDIEPEMSEADKQIFQSFAHAQVSVTNEIHQHLGSPRFLLCPTQYCSTRAVPNVTSSEYLNTLGTKLSQQIDIMWTGPKVISKILTTECIEEITQVLRRPPVIWDNLHANDYDQKRIYLGPYCGRSPELIPLLRGVLSNPNCEYNANLIAVRTLAHWAQCSRDAPQHMDSVSWDIKLERESEQGICEDEVPTSLGKHVYHHRQALRSAINEWLPEFSIPKTAQGPVIKPQPPVLPAVGLMPIVPSVNTCMSLQTATTSTATAATAAIPTVTATTLRALADDRPLAATGISSAESLNPVPNPVMNSLVSATKVILNESIPNPIIPMASSNILMPTEIPVSTLPVPLMGIKNVDPYPEKTDQTMLDKQESLINDSVIEGPSFCEDGKDKQDMVDENEISIDDGGPTNGVMSVEESPPRDSPDGAAGDVNMNDEASESGSMQVEPSHSPLSTDMMVEPAETIEQEPAEENLDDSLPVDVNALTVDDLVLLCDLFYLPFEHGARGLRLMHDFNWLTTHAAGILPKGNKPEMSEWRRRRSRFAWWVCRARRLARRLSLSRNRELDAELSPYVADLCGVLGLLHGFVRWLELGKFPPNIASNIQGSYTWFSKGWREAFESGCQEPWVFRGGLSADLRRLLPADPDVRHHHRLRVRPATHRDHDMIAALCLKSCQEAADGENTFPPELKDLAADRLVNPFLTFAPEFCMVLEEDDEDVFETDTEVEPESAGQLVGYACATSDWLELQRRMDTAWRPLMRDKYSEELLLRDDLGQYAKECIRIVRGGSSPPPPRAFPAQLCAGADPRLLPALLAALRAHGVSGIHVLGAPPLFAKLGFNDLGDGFMGRTF